MHLLRKNPYFSPLYWNVANENGLEMFYSFMTNKKKTKTKAHNEDEKKELKN